MSETPASQSQGVPLADRREDAVVRTSRREAVVALVIFVAALAWTIGYCSAYGYNGTVEDLKFEFGVPQWVFRGIVIPWAICTVIMFWFSFWYMDTSELEAAEPPPTDDDSPSTGEGA